MNAGPGSRGRSATGKKDAPMMRAYFEYASSIGIRDTPYASRFQVVEWQINILMTRRRKAQGIMPINFTIDAEINNG
jgi:hypothetical protein